MVGNDRIDCLLVKYNGFGSRPLAPADGRRSQGLAGEGGRSGPGTSVSRYTRRAFWIGLILLAMEVTRFCCKQLPGVGILGTCGGEAMPREYLAHAHQFVGLLKGYTDRRLSSKAFHSFLDSEEGSKLKENDGGDLQRAMHE